VELPSIEEILVIDAGFCAGRETDMLFEAHQSFDVPPFEFSIHRIGFNDD
jgi:hypothetical protein